MKNMIKKFYAIIVLLCLVFVSSMTVFAADSMNGFDAELYAEKELNAWDEKMKWV